MKKKISRKLQADSNITENNMDEQSGTNTDGENAPKNESENSTQKKGKIIPFEIELIPGITDWMIFSSYPGSQKKKKDKKIPKEEKNKNKK